MTNEAQIEPYDRRSVLACVAIAEATAAKWHDDTARQSDTMLLYHVANRMLRLIGDDRSVSGGTYPTQSEFRVT